jgi:hypothetical protein
MASTPEERKVIVSRLLKEGATQAEIAKAIGMSVATVNKAVKEIRAEETPACDLQKMDTLSKGGTSYRVTDVTGAVITAKSIVGDACIKPKEVTIPVAAYVSGKSGYRKLDIPPVKISKIQPNPVTNKPQENHEEVAPTSNEPTQVSKDDGPKKETVGEALERLREKPMTRRDILKKATHTVCHARQDQYGDPEDNFAAIARLWGEYLEYGITPKDVATMMILFKVARATTGKAHLDNWVDIAGYAALAGELESKEGAK